MAGRLWLVLCLDPETDREAVFETYTHSEGAALQAAWEWCQDEWDVPPGYALELSILSE